MAHRAGRGRAPGQSQVRGRAILVRLQEFRKGGGHAPQSHGAKALAVVPPQRPECCFAEPGSLFEHRVEHRREVAGRAVDDLQHLGHRRLSRQSLVALGSALGKLALQIGVDLLGIG
jgi:hypothetical protein